MGVIFDLDQTIIDSRIAYEQRRNRNWGAVYELIPQMRPYHGVVELIHRLLEYGIKVAIVTSSPRPYCEKVLNFLGIRGVTTVCYHDTERHKPDPEPLLLAIEKMNVTEDESVFAIGDEKYDIIAANQANVYSILGYWGNFYTYRNWEDGVVPFLFCRDEESLIRFFHTLELGLEVMGLRCRNDNIYQLFDYYPVSKVHDKFSQNIFEEVKGQNDQTDICEEFCRAIERTYNKIIPNTCGIFVVPSSKAGKWNSKLTNYVVPRLEHNLGLINCAEYILRHTTHDKQAFGGDRSVGSNLSTIKLQYKLPEQMRGAIIIDDITTTGNIFEACMQIICAEGIPRENIYCAAIGGTVISSGK